jgi:hypothetical protein
LSFNILHKPIIIKFFDKGKKERKLENLKNLWYNIYVIKRKEEKNMTGAGIALLGLIGIVGFGMIIVLGIPIAILGLILAHSKND